MKLGLEKLQTRLNNLQLTKYTFHALIHLFYASLPLGLFPLLENPNFHVLLIQPD